MAEYIEREAAYREICTDDTLSGYEKAYCCEIIKAIPAADVVPVRHGWWIYDHRCEFRCSVCGEFSNSKPYRGKENYCPNCGAKMNGGQNNETY